jgi:hypothetical protein
MRKDRKELTVDRRRAAAGRTANWGGVSALCKQGIRPRHQLVRLGDRLAQSSAQLSAVGSSKPSPREFLSQPSAQFNCQIK